MRKGLFLFAGIAMLLAIALTPGTGFAASAKSNAQSHHAPHIFAHKGQKKVQQRANSSHAAGTAGSPYTYNNMVYHGGPVMNGTTNVYAIFWEPSSNPVSANYNSLITRYFNDVGSSSLYQIAQQYAGTNGAPTGSQLAGSWVDTGSYPTSSGTVLDTDIQNEITHAQQVKGWQSTPNNIFFVFTGQNENLCIDSTQTTCASNTFCAYHSYFGANNTLYAAMPYAASFFCNPEAAPGVAGPNNNDADQTINVTSHEQMEAATDPLLNAWYDDSQQTINEIGDKCAWLFGPSDTNSADVSWNGDGYILQQEWNNSISGCSLVSNPTPQSYQLQNISSGLVQDVSGASTNAGAQVIQWGYNSGANQQWKFIPVGPFYQIVNLHSGLYLDVPGASTTAGTNLAQEPNNNGPDQQWYLVPDGIADQIVNLNSGLVVDVYNGGATFGANIIQYTSHNGYNQQWQFKVYPPITTFYQFQNHNSGLVADVANGGSTQGNNIIQYTNHQGANQEWILLPDGTHNGTPVYQIMNRNSGLIIDVNGAGTNAGATIIQWAQHNGLNQQWEFLPSLNSCLNGSYCQIENVNSSLVIDISGGSTALGANAVQEPSTNGLSQQWTLVAIPA